MQPEDPPATRRQYVAGSARTCGSTASRRVTWWVVGSESVPSCGARDCNEPVSSSGTVDKVEYRRAVQPRSVGCRVAVASSPGTLSQPLSVGPPDSVPFHEHKLWQTHDKLATSSHRVRKRLTLPPNRHVSALVVSHGFGGSRVHNANAHQAIGGLGPGR